MRRYKPLPDYDIPMRNIFRSGCPRFLARLGVKSGRLLDTDVSILRKRTIDFAGTSDSGIQHVEFQRSVDRSMSIRMLDYFGSILRLYCSDDSSPPTIRQVVVQIANDVPSGTVNASFGTVSIQYENVATATIPAAELIASDWAGDIVLSVLCQMNHEASDLDKAIRKLQRIAKNNFNEMLNHLLALSVATAGRYDKAINVLEKMPITISEYEIPFVKEYNQRAVHAKVLNLIIEYCGDRGRELTDIEFRAIGALSGEEADQALRGLWNSENVDQFLLHNLPSPPPSEPAPF